MKYDKQKKAPFCIQVSRYVRVNQDVLNERTERDKKKKRKEYLKEAFPFLET